jgi:hypothetical protein
MIIKDERKLTWGELKTLIESAGVRDQDEVDSIDISWGRPDQLECHKDDIFGWQIRL